MQQDDLHCGFGFLYGKESAMTNQMKTKTVNVVGFCGGGVFLLLNALTGVVPGGFIGGVLGYLICGGIAAFVVYVIMPKEQTDQSTPPVSGTGTGKTGS
jgi:hypothetical protein